MYFIKMWQNDENFLISQLSDDRNTEQCLRVLKSLQSNDKRWLRNFRLLDRLCKLLSSEEWELRYQATEFFADIRDDLSDHDAEFIFESICPRLITNVNDNKITIRRLSMQTLIDYCRRSEANTQYMQKILVRKMSTEALNVDFVKSLFIADLPNFDLTILKHEISNPKDDETLERLEINASSRQNRFGLIPQSIINALNVDDQNQRYDALESLKLLIEEQNLRKIEPHLFSFINFLGNLLDDFNIRIILTSLEILNIVVHKLDKFCEPYVQQIIDILSKQFGNQKNQVRRLNLSIVLKLAEIVTPKKIVASLCSYVQHRSSRVKEEILNLITILMLSFDGEETFNFAAIMYIVCPLGVDSKRRVRLAALECLAVVASHLDLQQVYQCARRIENIQNMPGYTKALEAKFAKRKLPKIRIDGLLEYSDLDFSNMDNDENADMAWIMSAGLGPGSAAHQFRSSSPSNRQLKPSPNGQVTINDKSVFASAEGSQQPNYELISAITGRNLLKIINNSRDTKMASPVTFTKSKSSDYITYKEKNSQQQIFDETSNNTVNHDNSKSVTKRHSSLGLATVQQDSATKAKISVAKSNGVSPKGSMTSIKEPTQALNNALEKLQNENWKDRLEGLNIIQHLSESYPHLVIADIHNVIIALNNEVKNLRSTVSRQALDCYTHLFGHLKKEMDIEVDNICKVLVPKTGDTSNAFIRDDALKALECMVDFSSPKRSLATLTTFGANHKNAVVRGATAQLIRRLVENLGAETCLKEQPREFGEKLINVLTKFAADSQPQPRMHGKAALALLALSQKDFQHFIGQNFKDQQQRNIFKAAETSGKASASSRQGSLMRNNSTRRKLTKISENDAQDLSSLCSLLNSSDWESRADGLEKFLQLSSNCPDHLANDPKILEAYSQRLNDINSKIACQALANLPQVISNLKSFGLRPMINDMMKNLSAQLPSKNEENRQLALQGFNEAIKSFDNTVLIQQMSTLVKSGNVKQRPDLVKGLSDICRNLLEQGKIKLVTMHAMPVIADLLKNYNQDLNAKHSINTFIEQLHNRMGRKVFLDACSNFPIQQKMLLNSIVQSF